MNKEIIKTLESGDALLGLACGIQNRLIGQSLADLSLLGNKIRALFLGSGLLDDAHTREFLRIIENEATLRIALAELIEETDLNVTSADVVDRFERTEVEWLVLITAAFAAKNRYPLEALDPSSPPALHTPAGMMLQQVSQFVRRQRLRTATERDRLVKKLAYDATLRLDSVDESQTERSEEEGIAPVPPYFRPPVPERYAEYNPDLVIDDVALDGEASASDHPPVPADAENHAGTHLVISTDDLVEEISAPQRMPSIRITADQIPPRPAAVPPRSSARTGSGSSSPRTNTEIGPSALDQLVTAVGNLFKSETLGSTRLRIIVQPTPTADGIYGIQVRVSCKGIRSQVAGTTNQNGRFVCELPVRLSSGLTYDVDVTWPEELGGHVERKSITLSGDRPQFELPFYRRLS